EEEAEEKGDGAERLLAAREQREPGDALAGRPQLDLDAVLALLVLGQPQPALAAGEERRRHLGEVALDRREGLGEPPLDRLRQVARELLELLRARLEVGALAGELVEPFLLGLVLLAGERVHLAELLAAALDALEPRRQLVAVAGILRLGPGRLQATPRLVALGVGARELDVDRAQPLGCLGRAAAKLDLRGAEAPQLRAELGRARRFGPRGER